MSDDRNVDLPSATRRRILRAGAGGAALAVGVGSASAHDYESVEDDTAGGDDHDHSDPTEHRGSENAELVGYHSLGEVGPASTAGRPDEPHYGGLTEMRVQGDYAYTSVFSSEEPTPGRGLAILDVSDYNQAESPDDLDDAEPRVLSFVANDNEAGAVMDVKIADDGEYVFLSKQPFTALFDEANDPMPGVDNESASAGASALQAVDVSDKGSPRVVATFDAWDVGPHNSDNHLINGTDYVFAVRGQDLTAGAALYVFEFDRTLNTLELVNAWTRDGNVSDGEIGEATTSEYMHDVRIENDPRTGTPTAYVSYWDAGLRVLDVSNPESVEEIGRFDMNQSHYAEPAPALIDGRRVCLTSHEQPSSDYNEDLETSGNVYLVDAEGIYEEAGVTDMGTSSVVVEANGGDPDAAKTELDVWFWQEQGEDYEEFNNFVLSPHNLEITREGWATIGHYHGGIRYLKIRPDDDLESWELTEEGHYLPSKDVPEDSRMGGLSFATPLTWSAVEQNGVTFASDINSGVYATRHERMPVGDRTGAYVFIDAEDDASAFTGGQTNNVELTVTLGGETEEVLIRGRVPDEWTVVGGDDFITYDRHDGDNSATYVQFTDAVDSAGANLNYFAEAPSGADDTGSYQFGPAEYSQDGGETWEPLSETRRSIEVVSVDTSSSANLGLVLGIAAGGGILHHYRDSVAETLSGLRSGGDEDGTADDGGVEDHANESAVDGSGDDETSGFGR